MKSFDSAIRQMLWPQERPGNITYSTASGKALHGLVIVTPETTYLRIPKGYLPDFLQPFVEPLGGSRLFNEDGLQLGPIPKGTPVNLISNIDLDERDDLLAGVKHKLEIGKLLLTLKSDIKALPGNATDEDSRKVFANVVDQMLDLSKCPDFVVNRGHYFGTEYFLQEPGLDDTDKKALIAFLKTL